MDNGTGMSEETLKSLFRPFFISDASHLSRKYGRIGIGLPLARQYAGILGGEITVASETGKGSTFTVALPKKQIGRTISP
jgi:signal transduction histidine kinase